MRRTIFSGMKERLSYRNKMFKKYLIIIIKASYKAGFTATINSTHCVKERKKDEEKRREISEPSKKQFFLG